MKFYPYKRGGGGSLSHAEGGGTTSFEVVLTQELEVLAIVIGGTQSFQGGGALKVLPCLEGGGARKMFWTRNFPIL